MSSDAEKRADKDFLVQLAVNVERQLWNEPSLPVIANRLRAIASRLTEPIPEAGGWKEDHGNGNYLDKIGVESEKMIAPPVPSVAEVDAKKLSRALSEIDYLLGEPNEMKCSLYDVDCDEQRVVDKVAQLAAKLKEIK